MIGGAGNDTLAGGAGPTVFVFEFGFGKDVVLDFQGGSDELEIEANINGLAITTTCGPRARMSRATRCPPPSRSVETPSG